MSQKDERSYILYKSSTAFGMLDNGQGPET